MLNNNKNIVKLFIHHHATFYHDSRGNHWITAFIGRWLSELSSHFVEIVFLGFETSIKRSEQDMIILDSNVSFISLGNIDYRRNRFTDLSRIISICLKNITCDDILIIRGSTPKQFIIWLSSKTKYKYYYLVGSLVDIKPEGKLNMVYIIKLFLYYWRRIEVKIISLGASMVANSPHLVEELKKFGIKSYYSPSNGLRSDEISVSSIRSLNPIINLLYCGRIVREKGIEELIHAVSILNKERIVHLTLVGVVDRNYELKLMELAKQLKIEQRISWKGRIPFGNDLFSFYRNSDFFVFPSYSEGFPHVIWEAFANNCPVITTNISSMKAILSNNVNCLMVDKKSSISISNAIEYLIEHQVLRQKIIINGNKLVEDFTLEKTTKIFADHIKETMIIP